MRCHSHLGSSCAQTTIQAPHWKKLKVGCLPCGYRSDLDIDPARDDFEPTYFELHQTRRSP